jgi:hypothetical protein
MPLPLIPIIIGAGAGMLGYKFFLDEDTTRIDSQTINNTGVPPLQLALIGAGVIAAYMWAKRRRAT